MGNTCCPAVAGQELRMVRRLGSKKVSAGGKTFSPYGMVPEKTAPVKCSSFSKAGSEGGPGEKVDLRQYMTAIEDQSQSNSCCANAIAGAYEYLNKRDAIKRGDTIADISRLFIYYVGRKKDQQEFGENTKVAPSDEGMTIGGAITALQVKGACMAADWPFDLERVNDTPDLACFDKAMRYKISNATQVPCDLDCMREALALGSPIVFGLKLTAQFFCPLPGGLIPTPDPSDPQSAEHGLHAMLLVGYNDRQQVFIVRNSWGESWADRGYAYVPYDYIANPEFNFLGMYTITGLTETDFTPDADDGQDFSYDSQGDGNAADITDYEEPVPPSNKDDSFDADDALDLDCEARRVFNKFDLNGSGTLDLQELHLALMMNGKFMTPFDLQKLIADADRDGKPGLSFEEFLSLCK